MVTHNEAIRNMADHVIKLRDGAVRHNERNEHRISAADLEWLRSVAVIENEKNSKSPLIKRIPRELLGDWKKYLVVALFLILTIGFVSGMYVANESMLIAANEGVTKYKLEDGHFELDKKADETLLAAIETGTKADAKQYYLDKAKKRAGRKA